MKGIAFLHVQSCAGASPVHDVGGESCREAQDVEAEFSGRAQSQPSHHRDQGQIHQQPCRGKGSIPI